ncbi:MBL fold metallo-hydrolase [Nisaea acidiphila]|uniref:MBL fold metallo-hydrolase n=1 Tax=Nisaea acidiphila TaxID=1862145 RepID=A0A9J7AV42_9PROT|nr:MBL fold metallo-hydrolase [Nisaea acidiphila]UUX50337.1 MBL fold metallo-hydrolase [Nisaea acidiphila]
MTTNATRMNRREALLAAAGTLAAPAILSALPSVAEAGAPMQGASYPTHYRFKLGKFEITTVRDGAIQLDGPHPIFGQNVTQEEVAKLAEENFLSGSRMEISFTPVIVNTGNEVIMFDSGNGDGRRPNAGQLASVLAKAGFTADQIDVVVLTHFHPDHIGGLMEGGQPLFPNARYVTGAAEYDFWSPPEMAEGKLARVGKLVQSNVVPFAEKMTFLKPGEDVVTGVQAVNSFGHTPGHMAYHFESEGRRLLAWADTTNHYVASLQRPDWHVRFDMDKEAAAASRKKVLDMVAAERIPATGYHMPFPAVGYVEKHGSGYRWIPASYQLNL